MTLDACQPICREMTPLERVRSRISRAVDRIRRKLPYLVWYGDELDVCVTFSRERLLPDGTIDEEFRALYGSRLAQVEQAISEMDIGFDRGVGMGGRDWEWDWSLRGPISVTFRSRAQKPERRAERPRPRLVCSN